MDSEKRIQELLEANTRLVEEKRAMDRRAMVAQLHRVVVGAPVEHVPQIPADERVRLRLRLLAEEFFETLEAAIQTEPETLDRALLESSKKQCAELITCAAIGVDLPEFADGLADLAYVIEGAACEFGIPSNEVFTEVHAANMRKGDGPMREDGKRLKPPGWQPPDVAGVLRKAGWQG